MKLVADDFRGAREDAEASFAVEPAGINASEALTMKARAELWIGDQDGARDAVRRWRASAAG